MTRSGLVVAILYFLLIDSSLLGTFVSDEIALLTAAALQVFKVPPNLSLSLNLCTGSRGAMFSISFLVGMQRGEGKLLLGITRYGIGSVAETGQLFPF